ncbi:MAG: 1-acyl-sn-glycerol-3-phosphate acyltransferase, partial [Gammaproteobacteria bacterium]|nr:1-acyl-sn-glycerol-3-phosphate acyltransferase [Gammaproteobacteria bacterium]
DIYNTIKLEIDIFSKGYPLYKCIMGFIISKDDLTRTGLGKLKRHEIYDRYLDELEGASSAVCEEELDESSLKILTSPLYKTISTIITGEKKLKDPLHLNDHLGMDLGFDSLSRIELISALESQFRIKISEALMAKISTVKELALKVDKLILEQRLGDVQSVMLVKEKVWQKVLKVDPAKNIMDKIDVSPGSLAIGFYTVVSYGLYVLSKMLWRIKISGIKNLPKDKPFILCPNHPSYLDAFLILASIPNWLRVKIFFLGDHIYFDVPVVRGLVKTGRIISLNPATNLVDSMRACSYVLRNGKAVCIFPEGGRSPDGSIQNFKKGVGILARELSVPLVPVHIDGAFQALPRGKFFPRFNRINIAFGKPYTSDQLKEQGVRLGAKDDYEAIAKGLEAEVRNLSQVS